VTLVFVAILMFFFYSEFRLGMKALGVGKRRLRRWVLLYTLAMLASFAALAYRNRDYLRKFIPRQ
jgi:hypothetical protein